MNSASVENKKENISALPENEIKSNLPLNLISFLPHFFLGFILSTPVFYESFSPVAAAFISAAKYKNCVAVFTGGCVGYLIYYPPENALKYIGALSLAVIFRLLLHKRPSPPSDVSLCCVSFFSLLLAGTVSSLVSGTSLLLWLNIFAEALISAALTFFYRTAIESSAPKRGIQAAETKDKICLCLSICTVIVCSAYVTIEGISPARVFFCLVLMFISLYKATAFSCVAGIIAGACLSLSASNPDLFPAFALGALISGLFSSYGQITVGLTFILPYAFSLVTGQNTRELWPLYLEPAIACLIFIVIPAEKLSQLQERIDTLAFFKESRINHTVSEKLDYACEKMKETAEVINSVSDKLDNIINPEVNRLFSSLQQNICASCENKQLCWKKSFASTARDILHLTNIEKKGNEALLLSARCKNFDSLLAAAREFYPSYTKALAAKHKNSRLRQLLSDELIVLGDYLSDLSDELAGERYKDKAKSAYLKTALRDNGITADALSCFVYKDRVRVEIYFYELPSEAVFKKIRPIIEFITGRRFFEGKAVRQELRFLATFDEKPMFAVSSGYSRHAVKPGYLCGDSVSVFSCAGGDTVAVISDGMGTGTSAAVNSNMAVALTEKLISCGFSVESTVRTVNSSLIIKSTDESLSTLDIVSVDTFSAKARFYKSGAAVSFIRHKDEITVIEKESLPLGIIREVSCATEERQLSKGDIILMVSDGVTATDCGWINDELLAWSTSNMNDLAAHISSLARLRNQESARDDITVSALKIEANK